MRRSSESAVALVMTLVFLSVITVMAVAFLALTQRERLGVTQSTQQSEAEMMADAGTERAKAEIFARYLAAGTNLNAVDLLVSRNYIRTNGFIPGGLSLLNVNYDYYDRAFPLPPCADPQTFSPVCDDDVFLNLANLYYDPRPPVFVSVPNPPGPPVMEHRFFLDLNRNGRFETNGAYPIFEADGTTNGAEAHFVGDPEWVGVLADPRFPHSRTNRFIGRYAYIVLPIGKSLDVNFIHNHAKTTAAGQDGFYRNQGFGSWEINLAGFLADLNTNVWGAPLNYTYNTNYPIFLSSGGASFIDALEIYNSRLSSYQNLSPARNLLFGANDFVADMIDGYADGLLDVNGRDNDNPNTAWAGAYNWTNFFTPHNFWDIFRPPSGFTNRLYRPGLLPVDGGLGLGSYDRYTYYRMLAQLSTDSAAELPYVTMGQLRAKVAATNVGDFVAEPAGKININYDNIDFSNTNMVPWDAAQFFTNVADVLLNSLNVRITNAIAPQGQDLGINFIPIYPTNYYTVTTHRLLQMAANIYDATSNSPLPSVFRPIISSNIVAGVNHLWISGYYSDPNAANVVAWIPFSHGMPMVIGAKKCIPNFNEYTAQTAVMAARKLEFRRPATNAPPNMTNEMFIIGVSNSFGLEAWNSCTQAYLGRFEMMLANNVTVTLTNRDGLNVVKKDVFSNLRTVQPWPGFAFREQPWRILNDFSFIVPLRTNSISIPNSVYRFNPTPHLEDISRTNVFTLNSGFRVPDWHLSISNNLLYILTLSNRIVDYVNFPNLTNHLILGRDLMNTEQRLPGDTIIARCWNTNRLNNPGGGTPTLATPTAGIQAQIDISTGNPDPGGTHWKDFSFDTLDKDAGILSFRQFMGIDPNSDNTNLIQQAPFTPARKLVVTVNWEVNDPLVHYMEEHLKDLTNNYSQIFVRPMTGDMPSNQTLLRINSRYQPWLGNPQRQPRYEDYDPTIKDPGITKSDDWDFPTNRFPSIGWLGRVHRGTPWQTIYMKADAAAPSTWAQFSLDPLSHPTNDWRLLDVFTVAIHPNASHGQLSINQTNFAAWSAVLSGVIALSNRVFFDANDKLQVAYEPIVIEPGSPGLLAIYEGIQRARERLPDQTFRRLGEIMMTRELTTNSPYLNKTDVDPTLPPYPAHGINDTAMERIPQQILSLLKVGDPRYVIYAWGQSLRPADNSILTSGDYLGMCTNYQVTGEFVARTVFQIEGTAGQPRPVVKNFNILSSD